MLGTLNIRLYNRKIPNLKIFIVPLTPNDSFPPMNDSMYSNIPPGASILNLSQAAFRTYWQAATHSFTSFLKKNGGALGQAGELLRAVSTAVVEKVQRLAEEGLEQAIAHVMGRSKQHSWFEMYPPIPTGEITTSVIDPDFELLEGEFDVSNF